MLNRIVRRQNLTKDCGAQTSQLHSLSRRGDTIVEIVFCFTIFSIITIISIGLMNRNLTLIQGTLEISMARNEIEAQAEAIRFIHNSYLSERELVRDQNIDPSNVSPVYRMVLIIIQSRFPNTTNRIVNSIMTQVIMLVMFIIFMPIRLSLLILENSILEILIRPLYPPGKINLSFRRLLFILV